jgi:hypothetical protein
MFDLSNVSAYGSKSGKLLRECSWLIVATEEWKMRQTTGTRKSPGEKIVKDIKRATRKHYLSEEKIRIVLDGLRGEDSIAKLCRRVVDFISLFPNTIDFGARIRVPFGTIGRQVWVF